jgi:LysR family nitrogen assimilation transcriptional regulator
MDILQLRYFICVAELGSFSRAAIMLDVGQPAISRQVRLLEVELRQNLLIRNGRGVKLTEAGIVLLKLGRGVLHQMETIYEELGRVEGNLAGKVSIGLPPTWSHIVVVPFMHLLQRELPHASVAFTEGLSISLCDQVIHGILDIALLYDVPPTPDLEIVRLKDEELFLISRKEDKRSGTGSLTLSQLAALPLVVPTRPNAIRMLLEREIFAMGLSPHIRYEIDGVGSILNVVRDGAAYAVLPISSVQTVAHSDEFTCRPVNPDGLKIRRMLAVSASRAATHTQKKVFTLLAELLRTTEAILHE